MEFRQLEYFQALCSHKSFSAAAKSLYITQQGLSKSIASLERQLGVTLVERITGGLKLTEAGCYLRDRSSLLLEEMETTQQHLRKLARRALPVLHLGMVSGASVLLPDRFLHGFSKKHPQLQLETIEDLAEACERDLMLGVTDLAFCNLPVNPDCFTVLPVVKVPVYAMVPNTNPLACEKSLTTDQLEGQPIVMTADQYRCYSSRTQKYQQKHPPLDIRYRVPELVSAYLVCQRGLAIGFSFPGLLELAPRDCVTPVPITNRDFRWSLGLLARRGAQLPAHAELFWNYTKSACKPK